MEDVEKTPEELSKEEKIAEFLGEDSFKDVEEENKVEEFAETEKKEMRKLNKLEFIYTDEGNVIMSQETYLQLMSKVLNGE